MENYQSLWFEAEEAGAFTLSWETANAQFDKLTLIDNITGVQTDMLTRDSYAFEGDPSQYASRFKIVIGEWKDVEENEETLATNFAFQMGDELIINGEGRLEIVDMMGRVLMTTELFGTQSHVRKPSMAAGLYVLRLTDGTATKVQKMVIK